MISISDSDSRIILDFLDDDIACLQYRLENDDFRGRRSNLERHLCKLMAVKKRLDRKVVRNGSK